VGIFFVFKQKKNGDIGGASDIVKAKSSGKDARATGGLVSNFPHPQINKTKKTLPGTRKPESICQKECVIPDPQLGARMCIPDPAGPNL